MYREHLMDHYKHPRRNKTLDNPSAERYEKNPSCGDTLTLQFTIQDDVITDVGFTGEGCAISMAAASMLVEDMPGMSVDEVLLMTREDMLELIGVPLTTMRVKCGLLGLHTAKKALYQYKGQTLQGEW